MELKNMPDVNQRTTLQFFTFACKLIGSSYVTNCKYLNRLQENTM